MTTARQTKNSNKNTQNNNTFTELFTSNAQNTSLQTLATSQTKNPNNFDTETPNKRKKISSPSSNNLENIIENIILTPSNNQTIVPDTSVITSKISNENKEDSVMKIDNPQPLVLIDQGTNDSIHATTSSSTSSPL